jgi:hypothetical protein
MVLNEVLCTFAKVCVQKQDGDPFVSELTNGEVTQSGTWMMWYEGDERMGSPIRRRKLRVGPA